MTQFSGIFPALLTPIKENGGLHVESLEKIIELNLSKNVDGFYVGGSTAEALLYSMEQRKEILKTIATLVKGRCSLIAHIGFIGTDQTIELGHCAEEAGYDCISSVPPFYYDFSAEEIKGHYQEIIEHVSLPLIIYNIALAKTLSLNLIREILADDRVVGIKNTSSDFFQFERIKQTGKILLSGPDEMFLAALAMGADGAIGSTLNVMAEKFIEIQRLFKVGKNQEALAIQTVVNTVIEALLGTGALFAGLKQMLEWMGIECGPPPKPFKPLSLESKKNLEQVYQTHLLG